MKAGTYYIGDLCYVMRNEWNEACDLFYPDGSNGRSEQGVFQLQDGREFACFNTAFGDGTYSCNQFDKSFCVDSGSIGCILRSDITDPDNLNIEGLGHYVTFENDFDVSSDGQTLKFGHIEIYTGDLEEEEGYYDDDEEY